jgi:hypothetical protein
MDDTINNLFVRFKETVIQFLPDFVFAILIFLIGYLLAHLLRTAISKLIHNIARIVPNKRIQSRLNRMVVATPVAKIISGIIFWIIIFFFLAAATEILGLPVITAWLSGITGYLPQILAAVLIGTVGLISGVILREIIITVTTSAGISYGTILGRLAQIIIVLLTGVIAVDQVGFDVSILISVVTIIIGAVLFGAAFAFGLGSRDSVSNILASYYLQKYYNTGQLIRIGEHKGKIIEIGSTALILETDQGQVYVPAQLFNKETSLLLGEEEK